ncbi:MAG: PrgI family protein [Candidatus Jacksonbacteria bacterium]|nr:PrgI family protein [Candidatus Jacksonbacteria bacterium]
MQYPVPQFIDLEPKIVGPITVRQFFISAAALGGIFLFFKYADTGLFIFATVILIFLTIVIGFVRVNGRPFHFFFISLIDSLFRTKHMTVWKKEAPKISRKRWRAKKENESPKINYVSVAREKVKMRSRLSDLSLLVDTGGYYENVQ